MNTRKILRSTVLAGAAIGGPLALAGPATADTVSSAPDCTPVAAAPAWTEIQYKYTPGKRVRFDLLAPATPPR